MIKLKDIGITWIIHLFALLHAVVTILCRYTGINDELFLTILTIAMVLLISVRRWLNIELAAICVIMANVIGYLLGNLGAEILHPLIGTTPLANAVSTAITTEILGWTIAGVSKFFHTKSSDKPVISFHSPQIQWLIVAITGIFLLRIGILALFSSEPFKSADIIKATTKVFTNSAAIITLIALNFLFIRWISKDERKNINKTYRNLILIAFFISVTMLETFLIGSGLPFRLDPDFFSDFPILFFTSFIAEITVFCIVYLVNYAINARTEAQKAVGMANIAQYRYIKLKQQVNPHFLFNSLNTLDFLVSEQKSEQASEYIHKLAALYRYMIKTEEEKVVTLYDELKFTQDYLDMLQTRFPEGLKVNISIPEDSLSRYVIPCSLQLLVENATKHNAVNPDRPLTIKINGTSDYVTVENDIIPKVGKVHSTGLGLKYMKQQYLDISGKNIAVNQDEKKFCVTIPLL